MRLDEREAIPNGDQRDMLTFDSYTEAIEYAHEHHEVDPSYIGRKDSPATAKAFTLCATWEEAYQLATRGWAEGRAYIDAMRTTLSSVIDGHVAIPEIAWDVCGDGGIDMGRYMSGEPEHVMDWRDPVDQDASKKHGKIIRLCVDFTCSGGVQTDTFVTRGTIVALLVESLELAGYSVAVDGFATCDERVNGSPGYYLVKVPIKRAGETMQPDQLAFALIHPSMYRRFMFAMINQCGQTGAKAARSGYGTLRKMSTFDCKDYDLEIPSMHVYDVRWYDRTSAVKWYTETLRDKYGITLASR